MAESSQADGSSLRDDSKGLADNADGTNYRAGDDEGSEPADGTSLRDDDHEVAKLADGTNYRTSEQATEEDAAR